MQTDLFGNPVPEKSFEDEYREYLSSSRWRRKRDAALKLAGHQCQRCGLSRWAVRLEVHHKTYDNFKHESFADLEVLCADCHKQADLERRSRVHQEQTNALDNARFRGWARKVFGEHWRELYDVHAVRDEFNDWLERNDG